VAHVKRKDSHEGRLQAIYFGVVQRKWLTPAAAPDATPQDELVLLTEKMLRPLAGDRQHADCICRLCEYRNCPQESCAVEQAVT